MTQRYEQLVVRFISITSDHLLPKSDWFSIERDDQRIALAVQEHIGMTPEHWSKLTPAEREPWLEQVLAAMSNKGNGQRAENPPNDSKTQATTAAETEAVWLGNRSIQIGDDPPFTLPQSFAVVLETLVEMRTADSEQLERSGGGPKKLGQMLKKFPQLKPFVTLPGGKGKGGYRTTICDGRESP